MTVRRSRWITGITLASIVLVGSSAAHAAGLGAYFEYGRGIAHQESGLGFDLDFDQNKYGFGFALDTAVARNRLFNYRLNLGYQRTSTELAIAPSADLNFNGFSINQMFGFGALRTDNLRVWLGPSVRINVDFASEEVLPGVDFLDLGIGGGLALGVNVHTGTVGSAAFTFGYQYLYLGEFAYGNTVNTEVFNGGEHLISLNLSYFFRSAGDRFRPRKKRQRDAHDVPGP